MRAKLPLLLAPVALMVYLLFAGHHEGRAPSSTRDAAAHSVKQPISEVASAPQQQAPTSTPKERANVSDAHEPHVAAELLKDTTNEDFVDLDWEERLAEMPPKLAAFFNKRSATYEEWTLAYREYLCSCADLPCATALQDDFASRKPALSDHENTERAVAALGEALSCASHLASRAHAASQVATRN